MDENMYIFLFVCKCVCTDTYTCMYTCILGKLLNPSKQITDYNRLNSQWSNNCISFSHFSKQLNSVSDMFKDERFAFCNQQMPLTHDLPLYPYTYLKIVAQNI